MIQFIFQNDNMRFVTTRNKNYVRLKFID